MLGACSDTRTSTSTAVRDRRDRGGTSARAARIEGGVGRRGYVDPRAAGAVASTSAKRLHRDDDGARRTPLSEARDDGVRIARQRGAAGDAVDVQRVRAGVAERSTYFQVPTSNAFAWTAAPHFAAHSSRTSENASPSPAIRCAPGSTVSVFAHAHSVRSALGDVDAVIESACFGEKKRAGPTTPSAGDMPTLDVEVCFGDESSISCWR